MTKRKFCILFLALACAIQMRAQPAPCAEPPAMTPTCTPACVICDIDGFTGINNSTTQGQAPPGFCTTIVHHMQWIAFIAGSTNLTLDVQVFSCQGGPGLEIGIYQSSNCQTFQLVSNCNTDVQNNTTATFTNTVPLVVGQYYYFVMDGNQGDICNYTIHVVEGSTAVSPLFSSGDILGEFNLCPGSAMYAASGVTGATEFTWMVDGATVAQGPTPVINWTTTGAHELCVIASNACDEAPASCQTVNVTTIPPQQITASLCTGECLDVADTSLCDPGSYVFHFTTANGCDSVIQVDLDYNAAAVSDLDLHICDGDTLFVAGQPFFQTGQYQEMLQTAQGCDSIINLALNVVICQISGDLAVENVACNGASTGQLNFSVANGTPPFHYAWERVGQNGPTGQGNLAGLNTAAVIGNLPVGSYLVTVSDNFGNQLILIGEITSPPALTLGGVLSDFMGFSLSCASAADGGVAVQTEGGTPPYAYLWNNGSAQSALNGLSAGNYSVTVTDAKGCTITEQFTLTGPPPIVMDVLFTNPDCEGPGTGSVGVESVSGGASPYAFDLSGGGFGPAETYESLTPGNYVLTVRDANGCTLSQSGTLTAPVIPAISVGEDLTVDLGEEVFLQGISNVPLDSILWTPAAGLSCATCLEPFAKPSETTTYTLSVASADGCFRSDTLTVRVNKIRNVYIPNVFSPNDDGRNDRLVISGNAGVETIQLFRVYSRWGELVYEARDLDPDDLNSGWDGSFRGKSVNPGVFTWLVEVKFIDGVVLPFQGTVTVLP